MASRRWRTILVRLTLALAVLAVPGCVAIAGQPDWSAMELPQGFRAETLAVDDDRLLVGGRSIDPARPTLLVADSDTLREVPLRPESSYGKTANLTSIAAVDDRVVAIGGDRGGAHGNVRWSVWSGTSAALTEREQSFWTFGGQRAGSLTTIVQGADGPMIIGNWGARYGIDITVWTVRDGVWTRHDSAGSALASTARELLSERSAATVGQRVIIAGVALDLAADLVPRATTWTLNGGAWSRHDLPVSGTRSSALDLACTEDECLVAGVIDGRVAGWVGDATDWREVDLPDTEADEGSVQLRVLRTEAGWWVAVGDRDQVTVLDPDSGRTITVPRGTLIDAAGIGGTAYVLAETTDGTRTLWHGEPPGR